MHITQQKEELRQSIAQRLSALTPEQREAESRSICRRILENIPKDAVICVYNALKKEPDLQLLISSFLESGQPVYMARFADQQLEFRQIEDMENLVKGELNILEPPAAAPLLPADQSVVVIVPGRAFDKNCNRLGRGNGGYDKWIQKQQSITTVGAAFEWQMVNEVPVEEHDQPLDMVITSRDVYTRENN